MKINMKKFVTGPLENNTYVIWDDSKELIIIDPSAGCEELLGFIKESDLEPVAVLLTHGHFDHFLGLTEIHNVYPKLDVWANELTVPFLSDPEYNGASMIGAVLSYTGPVKTFTEGTLNISNFQITVLHIPGHSPGGSAFVFDGLCFSGDSLFAGSIGRTDFLGCDSEALIKNIKEKLLTLPDDTVVCSGHGGRTTIGREKRLNPFLR